MARRAALLLVVPFAMIAPPATAAKLRCAGILWRTHRDGARICPREHGLVADISLRRLRWSAWGRAVATASGFKAHTVFPGGQLKYSLSPVTIRLSRPKRCADGARIYSYFEMTEYTRRGQPTSTNGWLISCSGKTGSAGEG